MADIERKSNMVLLIDYINTTWEYLFSNVVSSTIPGSVDHNRVAALNKLLEQQEDFARSLGIAANLEYAEYLEEHHKKVWGMVIANKIDYASFVVVMAREKTQEERLKYLQAQNN